MLTETFESNDLSLLRRNPWMLGLAATPFLLSVAALIAGAVAQPGFAAFAFHPFVLGLLAMTWVWSKNPRPIFETVPVRANAKGIRVGARFVPRPAIRAGLVVPAEGDRPIRVQLQLKGGFPIELAVRDAAEGRRLLHALGLDASQTVATFRAVSRAVASPKNVFFTFLGSAPLVIAIATGMRLGRTNPAIFGPTMAVALISFLAMLAVFAMPTRVDVGADGLVMSWFWRKRFIPYRAIDAVTRFSTNWGKSHVEGVSLLLSAGETVRIGFNKSAWDQGRAAILHERIDEAMETWRQGGAESDAALLERGDRGIAEWIVALRSIGTGANAGPRTAPVPAERLWRIVEDPRAEARSRAAAAIALGAEVDEGGRARLRAAAEATAAPKLRFAIEAAASDEGANASVDEALAEIEAEAEAAQQKRAAP